MPRQITGKQLAPGDTVYVSESIGAAKPRIDEILVEITGRCDQGIHWRTKRNSTVCYDRAAICYID